MDDVVFKGTVFSQGRSPGVLLDFEELGVTSTRAVLAFSLVLSLLFANVLFY